MGYKSQIDALPLVSYGRKNASKPPKMIQPPETYTGTDVVGLSYIAIIGP